MTIDGGEQSEHERTFYGNFSLQSCESPSDPCASPLYAQTTAEIRKKTVGEKFHKEARHCPILSFSGAVRYYFLRDGGPALRIASRKRLCVVAAAVLSGPRG